MGDLLKLFAISFSAQLLMNYFNFAFLFSKIKPAASYAIPLLGVFTSWRWFTVWAWLLNIPIYLPGTLMVVWTYRISWQIYGNISKAMLVGSIANLLTSLLFIYITTGQILDKNGWIAFILVMIAFVFVAK